MNNLSGKYLVDKIEWLDGKTILSDGRELPLEYWFDVDMEDEFWKNRVENGLPPTLERINRNRRICMLPELTELPPINFEDYMTETELLYDLFWAFLDKVFTIEPVSWRIRKLEEIRSDKINEILGIENGIYPIYELVDASKEIDEENNN